MNARQFDFYGVGIEVQSGSEEVLDAVGRDFSFFSSSGMDCAHRILVQLAAPNYPDLPAARPLVYTPRNVSYRDGEMIHIDYFGRALVSWQPRANRYQVQAEDAGLAHEIVYLTMLSLVGEQLDRRGIHRVHALGVCYHGRATIITLPPGGGKTTLLKALLACPEIKLLSEDSPLVTRAGDVLAFPLRLGFVPGTEPDVPAQFVRRVERMEFGPKVLVDIEYYRDRLANRAEPGVVFLGARRLAAAPSVTPASRGDALKNLSRHCVIGLGLYQGLEFAVQHGFSDLLKRGRIAWSRLRSSNALARRSRLFHLKLGRDSEANARAVIECLANTGRS